MSGDDLSALERAWAVLVPPRAKQLSSYPLDLTFGGVPCRVALDAAGARHVLLPIDGEAVQADQRPSVLSMSVRRLRFGDDDAIYVDLSCAERDLFAEFDEVVDDVLDAAREADRPGAAAVRAIGRWRRLFRSRLMRGLSYQAKLGLFAELTMLSALLDAQPAFAVDLWRGPLKEPHDFEAPTRCLEVKALGPDTDNVTIHGLEQLDTHDGRPLDLVLVRVLEDSDGTTLSELIDRVRDKVTSQTDLRIRLTAAGWIQTPDFDNTEAFTVAEIFRAVVDGDVPRLSSAGLVDGTLPQGITELRYCLDVAALLPFASSASMDDIAETACW